MIFREDGHRPSDRRGFVHKKLLGIGKKALNIGVGFVPGLSTARDIISTGRSLFGRPRARATVPRTLTARPSFAGEQGKAFGRELKFGGAEASPPQLTTSRARPIGQPLGFDAPPPRSPFRPRQIHTGTPCDIPGTVMGPDGKCRLPGDAAEFGFGVGDAVMGRYGAALTPGLMVINRSVCLRGMTLGNDGLCYNKGSITNSQRQWPRGRRPLLTGGDMNAISIAARAGTKLDRTTKRLRSLGMMKALPKGRGRTAHAHAKPVAAVSV